jgi:hypothetical protein
MFPPVYRDQGRIILSLHLDFGIGGPGLQFISFRGVVTPVAEYAWPNPIAEVAHRHVFYLGEINDSQRAAWERTISVIDERDGEARQIALFPADGIDALQVRLSGMGFEHPRQWGGCRLGDELWRRRDAVVPNQCRCSRHSLPGLSNR